MPHQKQKIWKISDFDAASKSERMNIFYSIFILVFFKLKILKILIVDAASKSEIFQGLAFAFTEHGIAQAAHKASTLTKGRKAP